MDGAGQASRYMIRLQRCLSSTGGMEVLRHFVIATACISTMIPAIGSSDVGDHFLLQMASVQRLLRMELLNRSLEFLVMAGLYLKLGVKSPIFVL